MSEGLLRVRLFVQCADEAAAQALVRHRMLPALGQGLLVRSSDVQRYWKVREWFEVRLLLAADEDDRLEAARDRLLGLGAGGWTHGTGDAVWNPADGSTLLAPEVRWAHVELLEDGEGPA